MQFLNSLLPGASSEEDSEKSFFQRLVPLVRSLFYLTVPTFFTILLENSIPVVTTVMIGSLGEKYLAAGSLGGMIVNASGYSLVFGMASALDMLCSHAFGSKEYGLVGLYAQRGAVILSLLCIPIVCFWLFTERLLILCNVNEEIAHLAYVWVVWQALTIWPITMEGAFRRFLVAQSIVLPQMAATVLSVAWHVLATFLLVRHSDLGFFGAIIVIPLTYWVMLTIMVLGYVAHYFYYKRKFDSMSESDLADLVQQHTKKSQAINSEGDSMQQLLDSETSSPSSDSDEKDTSEELKSLKAATSADTGNVGESLAENLDEIAGNDRVRKDSKKHLHDEIVGSEEKGLTECFGLCDQPVVTDPKALYTWPRPSLNVFAGWKDFLYLGVPAAVSLFLEWGSFEVNAIFISFSIGNSSLSNSSVPIAVHALLCNTSLLWYVFPAALSVAATTLIGNSLGARDAKNARQYAIIAFAVVVVYSVINGALSMFYRHVWFLMWTRDDAVLELSVSCAWIMWFYHVADCIKCVGISVVRGCGKYMHSVVVNAVSCIFFGYPISFFFGNYLGYGVKGVWFGMGCAWAMASIIYCAIIFRIDWEQESEESIKRTNAGLSSMVHS